MTNEYHDRLSGGKVSLRSGTAKERAKIAYLRAPGSHSEKLAAVLRNPPVSSRTGQPVKENTIIAWIEDVRKCGPEASLSKDGFEELMRLGGPI